MHRLTIYDGEDEEPIVSIQIQTVDPSAATVAILQALSHLGKPRKPRSDKGKPRTEPNV